MDLKPAIPTGHDSARKKSTLIPIPTPIPICRVLGVGVGIGIAFEMFSMVQYRFANNYLAEEWHHGPVSINDIQLELLI